MRILCKDHTHETGGIRIVGADLVVYFDQALLNNRGDFPAGQRILQPIAEKNVEGERFPESVRPRRRARSLETRRTGMEAQTLWYARMYHSVCQASMMKVQQDA